MLAKKNTNKNKFFANIAKTADDSYPYQIK